MWRDALTRLFPALAALQPPFYVVGGAIRDLVLEREPQDADVASLDPHAHAQSLGGRMVRLGNQEHLTAWRVVLPPHVYDFAALEGGNIADDLARRDFTVNAMAVHYANDVLLDPHGGRNDARDRIVRMIDASNFDDDPLRTLKGVRMAVKYGMTLDEATLAAIRARAAKIASVAAERVMYELHVILATDELRKASSLLWQTGLADALSLRTREFAADQISIPGALALLVDDPRAHAKRWKWSDMLLQDVFALQRLIEHHDRLALYDAGLLNALRLVDVLAAIGIDDELDLPDFNIRALLTGEEIAALTALAPGAELGRVKRALLEAQVRGEVTTRAQAETFVLECGG